MTQQTFLKFQILHFTGGKDGYSGNFSKVNYDEQIFTEREGRGETHRLVLKGELPTFSVVFDFNLS